MKNILIVIGIASLYSCMNPEQAKEAEKKLASETIIKANQLIVDNKDDSVYNFQFKEYSIKRISGKEKYGGTTKVQYINLSQLISRTVGEEKKQMSTPKELKDLIDGYSILGIGGQIRLDVERNTIDAADMENFKIIIKDENDKEIFRKQLDQSTARPHSNDYWWNLTTEVIDKRIRPPFFIYIVDQLEKEPFKFEVTGIKK